MPPALSRWSPSRRWSISREANPTTCCGRTSTRRCGRRCCRLGSVVASWRAAPPGPWSWAPSYRTSARGLGGSAGRVGCQAGACPGLGHHAPFRRDPRNVGPSCTPPTASRAWAAGHRPRHGVGG
jgi:hypothetical protein